MTVDVQGPGQDLVAVLVLVVVTEIVGAVTAGPDHVQTARALVVDLAHAASPWIEKPADLNPGLFIFQI